MQSQPPSETAGSRWKVLRLRFHVGASDDQADCGNCSWPIGSVFGERGNRHGLVVQLTFRSGRERRNLAIRIETGQCTSVPENVVDTFDLFLDALFQNQL